MKLGTVGRLIRQPLPLRALQRERCPLGVVKTKLHPRVMAEVELGQVAVNVLRVHVLVRADQTALKDRKEAFKVVGVNVTARPFEPRMMDAPRPLCKWLNDGRESGGFRLRRPERRATLRPDLIFHQISAP